MFRELSDLHVLGSRPVETRCLFVVCLWWVKVCCGGQVCSMECVLVFMDHSAQQQQTAAGGTLIMASGPHRGLARSTPHTWLLFLEAYANIGDLKIAYLGGRSTNFNH